MTLPCMYNEKGIFLSCSTRHQTIQCGHGQLDKCPRDETPTRIRNIKKQTLIFLLAAFSCISTQLSSDVTTRKKMYRRKSHQNRLEYLPDHQKNLGSARFN